MTVELRIAQDEWNRIAGMRCVRQSGFGINHLFAVSVIGGDDSSSIHLLDRADDPAKATVNRFDCFDRRRQISCVADHVAVGEIDDVNIGFARFQRTTDFLRHHKSAHLRLLIVSRNVRRWNQNSAFARIFLLGAAAEKVSNVSVLFGFGDSQIADVVRGQHIRQRVFQRDGRKDD